MSDLQSVHVPDGSAGHDHIIQCFFECSTKTKNLIHAKSQCLFILIFIMQVSHI